MCDDLFLIVCCPNKYITQKMCDEAVDDSLAALKLPDWFLTSFSPLYADENTLYFGENSGNAVIMKWVLLILILIILILIIILMKMILILLFLSDFWLGILNSKKVKNLNKDK